MTSIVRLTSPFDGYRRGGVAHQAGKAEYPTDKFDDGQLKVILADPLLAAEIVHVEDQGEPERFETLLGSSTLPSVIEMPNGSTLALGEIVAAAHVRSGLSALAWNELADDERERNLCETGQLLIARQLIGMELAVRGSGSSPATAIQRIYSAFPISPEGRSGTAREAPSAGSGDDALQAPSGTQSAAPHAFDDTGGAPASEVKPDADLTDAGGADTGGTAPGDVGGEAGAGSEAAPASNPPPAEPVAEEPKKAAKAKKGKAS